LFRSYLAAYPIGKVFFAPLDVVFSQFDVVEPDLLYLSNARALEALTSQHVRGVPEIVVEVASPSTRRRDETIKRRLYERMGVAEYWIVDPRTEVVRVYRRDESTFARVVEFSREAGDALGTALMPGFELPLARIFGE
jgi:Uma2 family endonuclease